MRATEKMEDGLERRTSMVKVSPETSAAYTKYRTKLSPQTSDDVKRVAVVGSCLAFLSSDISQLMDASFMLAMDCGLAPAGEFCAAHIDATRWCWETIVTEFARVDMIADKELPRMLDMYQKASTAKPAMLAAVELMRAGKWDGSEFVASAIVDRGDKSALDLAREIMDQLAHRTDRPASPTVKVSGG